MRSDSTPVKPKNDGGPNDPGSRDQCCRKIILGACNPELAYKGSKPSRRFLLPCNVTVRQDEQQVKVALIDAVMLTEFVGNPDLKPLAAEAKRKLQAVLEKI